MLKKKLLICLCFVALVFANVCWAKEYGDVGSEAQTILKLVNSERTKQGVRPLVLDKELIVGAKVRAKELTQLYSHTRPDGTPCFTVLGYHNAYKGENIAAGYESPEAAMDGWMNSPGHRANILSKDFTKLGVGYYYKDDSEYKYHWVQMFLGPDI